MSYDAVRALLSKGVSRTNLYEVMVSWPRSIGGQESNDQLRFLCSRTAVPPVSVNAIAVNGHEAQGVTREQVTMITFNSPFSITVVSDRDYTVYKDLKRWFDLVAFNANPYNSVGPLIDSGDSQRVRYYDAYRRDIQLTKLEQQGGKGSREPNSYEKPFRIVFNSCFPARIGELSLDSNGVDTMMEFQVDFAYESYTFLYDNQIEDE